MLPHEYAQTQPIFYVAFTFANVQYKLAQMPIHVGDILYTDGLLEFDYTESISPNQTDPEQNTVTCQLAIPGVDILELWARGITLDGVAVEFGYYLWRSGVIQQDYEDRIILYVGQFNAPQFGDPEDPNNYVSVSIEAQPHNTNQTILNPNLVIDSRFTDRDLDTCDGKPWPLVFGSPGAVVIGGTKTNVECTPAYCIKKYNGPGTFAQFMIAGHDIVGGIGASVTIVEDNGKRATKTPQRGVDIYGNVYFYIELNLGDNIAIPGSSTNGTSKEWWIYWNCGAHVNNFEKYRGYDIDRDLLTRAGDLVRWALLRNGSTVDWGAWANVAGLLNKYKFDGYINDNTIYAWEWLQGNILPLLPIRLKMGVNGLRPVLLQTELVTHLEAVARLYVDSTSDIQQINAVETITDIGDIVNDLTMHYGYSAVVDDYITQVRNRDIVVQPTDISNMISKLSVNKYGVRMGNIDSMYVYDTNTATMITQHMIQMAAVPRYTFDISAPNEFGYLQVGDIVEVTNNRLYLTDHKMTIYKKQWAGDMWIFGVLYTTLPIHNER